MLDIQFYRQKALSFYIVDFYAPAVNLMIEIDGANHLRDDNIEQDQCRNGKALPPLEKGAATSERNNVCKIKETFSYP